MSNYRALIGVAMLCAALAVTSASPVSAEAS